jgi:hypothetical protein
MTSLYYDFNYLVSKKSLCLHIFNMSIFEEAKEVYVFTMTFVSYPIYSHDFSRISSNITLHKLIKDSTIVKTLSPEDFPNRVKL